LGDHRSCQVEIHLPLAVDVQPEPWRPGLQEESLLLRTRSPLDLDGIKVVYSRDARPSDYSPELPVNRASADGAENAGGWQVGDVVAPVRAGDLLLTHPLLGRALRYTIPWDPLYTQLRDAIAHLYKSNSMDLTRGKMRFENALLDGKDKALEVAMANVIAIFGWPVLFGGSLADSAEGQPQMPDVDLIALDVSKNRVLAISLKGEQGSKGGVQLHKIEQEVSKVQRALVGLRQVLPSWWTIHGLLVYNHVPSAEIAGLTADVQVRGREFVQRLLNCTDRAEVNGLLWPYQELRGLRA